MTNNELSKNIILTLHQTPSKSLKFNELAKAISVDKKRLALNLFYLEANSFLELRSVYSSDALFPEIYMVYLKAKGQYFAENKEKLNMLFPSDMEYGMQNLPLLLENLQKALSSWAGDDLVRRDLYEKISTIFKEPLFFEFIEEFYSGKRAK
ncbi:MAG: hypothetical protein OHK0040_08290 [bacterium]